MFAAHPLPAFVLFASLLLSSPHHYSAAASRRATCIRQVTLPAVGRSGGPTPAERAGDARPQRPSTRKKRPTFAVHKTNVHGAEILEERHYIQNHAPGMDLSRVRRHTTARQMAAALGQHWSGTLR